MCVYIIGFSFDQLQSNFPIAWIDVEPSSNKAIVRFKEANAASLALGKLTKEFEDGKMIYNGSEIISRLIEGCFLF